MQHCGVPHCGSQDAQHHSDARCSRLCPQRVERVVEMLRGLRWHGFANRDPCHCDAGVGQWQGVQHDVDDESVVHGPVVSAPVRLRHERLEPVGFVLGALWQWDPTIHARDRVATVCGRRGLPARC